MTLATPRASPIVRGVDDNGIVVDLQSPERIEDPANVVIEFLNRVAVFAKVGCAFELDADTKWRVKHRVREIEKEGSILVLLHKPDCFVGVNARQFRGVGRSFHDLSPTHQRHATVFFEIDDLDRIQVVQQSEVVIESLLLGQERRVKTKVPFADASRRVAVRLQQLGNRQFIRIETDSRIGTLDPRRQADSARVTTGQQAGARRTADRRGRVVIRESDSLRGHGVDTRCCDLRRSIAAKVVVPLIVDEDEDDVGLHGLGAKSARTNAEYQH